MRELLQVLRAESPSSTKIIIDLYSSLQWIKEPERGGSMVVIFRDLNVIIT